MKPVSTQTMEEGLRWVIADKRGRAVIKWLLARCAVEGPVPTDDMSLAAWAESRRSLGRELRKAITNTYDRYKIVDIEEEDHG